MLKKKKTASGVALQTKIFYLSKKINNYTTKPYLSCTQQKDSPSLAQKKEEENEVVCLIVPF